LALVVDELDSFTGKIWRQRIKVNRLVDFDLIVAVDAVGMCIVAKQTAVKEVKAVFIGQVGRFPTEMPLAHQTGMIAAPL
jgi:hypothetical protein